MSFLKRRAKTNTELPSLDPSTFVNNRNEVFTTIEHLEIPRDRLVIVGSAVLTLLGLPRRAHDIDLLLHPDDLRDAHLSGALPNGIAVVPVPSSRLEQLHLQAATTPLPSELLSHQTPMDRGSFDDFIQFRTIAGPGKLRLQQPGALRTKKAQSIRIDTGSGDHHVKRAQDRYDTHLLDELFRQSQGPR